jgi:energy-coupling factor transport system ATP-binding protein
MLNFKNITYSYPFQKEPAVKNISFDVLPGKVGLITGESGCGKSTIIKIANGLIPHYFKGKLEGEMLIDGTHSSDTVVSEISKLVGTLFQDPEQQFFCNDVYSEIAFAHETRGKSPKTVNEIVKEYSEKFELKKIIDSSVFTLSEGEKQKLALASILSLEPKTIVLDEPSANLSPEATIQLATQIKKLKENGFAILIADHRLYWLADIADKVFVMKGGEICERGPFSILKNNILREKYGLRNNKINHNPLLESESNKARGSIESNQYFLEIKNLTFGYKNKQKLFNNYSAKFPCGKVIALTGANGVGKTTLSRLTTGLLKTKKGEFFLNNKKVSPKKLLKKTSLVLQNTDHQLYSRTVLDEILLSDKNKNKVKCIELLKKFQLGSLAQRHPQSLSGGQKQRLVIAATIAKNSDIIILDEPTSGLDGANMKIIGNLLESEAKKNKCIIVITHDLEFLNKVTNYEVKIY